MEKNKFIYISEQWFSYYKRVYNIFLQMILMNRDDNNLNMQLSFFNSISQDEYDFNKGQIVKLELFKNNRVLNSISLKTCDSEEQLFQYVWIMVVNHFISENYNPARKIKINEFGGSTRSFKYLLSEIKNNADIPMIRANFSLTYNKSEYDEMLHHMVLNHNNYHDNNILVNNVRNYILNNLDNDISEELNSSFNQSRKVYEHLINSRHVA